MKSSGSSPQTWLSIRSSPRRIAACITPSRWKPRKVTTFCAASLVAGISAWMRCASCSEKARLQAWRSASRATPLPHADGSPTSTASSGPSWRSRPNRATKPTASSAPSIVIAHLRSAEVSIARSTQPAASSSVNESRLPTRSAVTRSSLNQRWTASASPGRKSRSVTSALRPSRGTLPVEAVAGDQQPRPCGRGSAGRAPGERWSTYQTSSSIRSSQGIPARPLTWAQPVSPGLTSSRRRWWGV